VIQLEPYVPKQGDIVWITLDPTLGHEEGGRRPAIVLSGIEYNSRAKMAVVCPITSRAKKYPYEVALPGGQAISGVNLADQVRCIDIFPRRIELATSVQPATLMEVFDKLRSLMPGICDREPQ
jgi:mRNA interferase MazF